MEQFTLADLIAIMRECAGEEGDVNLDGDVLDTPFADLGYDSLALLETAAVIERQYRIRLADDVVTEARTPRAFVGVVNECRATV